ncbi:unnamed protein product [Arctia plantaginis]|uniref:Uncharacterized protein n=1 Tax=Arctia plantaginis TaxID=874455 RepID=A0A8S0ZNL6_ARCPL|nr:unnamed protein product [Arctia plantaginis]CAB3238592.1 unnamed protein product [Arctia plantaginis]
MMVVHEDREKPVEVAIIRKPLLEQKSYIIVKNHVKELSNTAQNTTNSTCDEKNSLVSLKRQGTIKKRKYCKRQKLTQEIPTTSSESDNINQNGTEIDASDLNELKTVYAKCKEVMKRIESKYGHLLNLDSEEGFSLCRMKQNVHSESYEDECNCKPKKKIVFDDEGRQSTVDVSDKHICVQNTRNVNSAPSIHQNIAVEYQDAELGLPETLQELRELLQDPDIEDTYRNRIFDKIRLLRAEYTNEIKFNKHILIDKLKTNPDDLLNFKGTNLSTIPGYS